MHTKYFRLLSINLQLIILQLDGLICGLFATRSEQCIGTDGERRVRGPVGGTYHSSELLEGLR